MANTYSPSIPAALRRQILQEDNNCKYCGAPWATVVDHVIPVAQDGATVRANLVSACSRCNTDKSGRTPAQWKAGRLAKGLSWPPPDCQCAIVELVKGLDEGTLELVHAAFMARYPDIMDATRAINDRYYKERPRDADEDRAELVAYAHQYRAEITV